MDGMIFWIDIWNQVGFVKKENIRECLNWDENNPEERGKLTRNNGIYIVKDHGDEIQWVYIIQKKYYYINSNTKKRKVYRIDIDW
jgi:hypothetical protein